MNDTYVIDLFDDDDDKLRQASVCNVGATMEVDGTKFVVIDLLAFFVVDKPTKSSW